MRHRSEFALWIWLYRRHPRWLAVLGVAASLAALARLTGWL